MAKTIVSLLDTDELEDYVRGNLDMFDLDMDDEGEEVPDELVEKAVGEVMRRSTNGALRNEVWSCLFDTWVGEKFNDMVWECVDGFVHEVVNEVLTNKKEG